VLNIENLEKLFYEVVNSKEWTDIQEKFNNADDIYILGHGGNLAVASHAAIDISRLSNGTKNAQAPDSATVVTSLINDTDFDQWMVQWLKIITSSRTKEQKKKSLVLGFSSSGTSRDLIKAFQWSYSHDIPIACITAKPLVERIPKLSEVAVGCDYYHTIEVLSLLLQYELTHGSGKVCPPIGGNRPEDIAHYNTSGEIREYSFPDELKNIAVDFDGVLHKNSKGYYDGTCYDEPVEGARESLKRLSENYDVVIFSAKSKSDRGLVDGKTGTQLVWEWLEKHKMSKFVTKVTEEKPRAVAYIDDKSIEFDNWEDTWKSLQKKGIVPWDTEWTDGRQ
jgi:phosphoheptose isomerase